MKPYKNRPKIIKGDRGIKTDDVVATAPIAKTSFHRNRIDRMHHNVLVLYLLRNIQAILRPM